MFSIQVPLLMFMFEKALTITTAAFSIISRFGGAGTHVWAATRDTIQLGLKYGWAYAFVWSVSVSVTKFSIILFYRRTFLVQDWKFRAWLHFLSFITLGFMVSLIVANFNLCQPLSYYWRQFEPEAKGRCNDAALFLLITGILNAVIDVIILVTPIPVVLKLKMSAKKKLCVCGIILSGSIVCIASFIRIAYLVSYWKAIDKPWIAGDVSAWSSIESSFGLISVSLPMLRPLYTRFRDRRSKGPWSRIHASHSMSGEQTSRGGRISTPAWRMTHDSMKQSNTSWQSSQMPSFREDETLLTNIKAGGSIRGEETDSGGIIKIMNRILPQQTDNLTLSISFLEKVFSMKKAVSGTGQSVLSLFQSQILTKSSLR
ncbi:hypothetical protein F5Y08DRAFT_346841 [Xylaria arbuscula]|nr:hypothetical protein F5Y08DRAFT_346841 [Xylaria arbuscula]